MQFRVFGIPAPKGSKKGFVVKGRAILVEQSKGAKPWQYDVHWAARESNCEVLAGPVCVDIQFLMPRPKSMAKKKLNVWHTHQHDLDKLQRCSWDGLTGVCFIDDGQVAMCTASKRYCNPDESPGAFIRVQQVDAALVEARTEK